jgi:hypothetical protein
MKGILSSNLGSQFGNIVSVINNNGGNKMNIICTKCNIEKPENCYRISSLPSGNKSYRSHCKECEMLYSREYYKSNKQICSTRYKKYCIKNEETLKKSRKKRYDNNKEKMRQKRREYYQNNRKKEIESTLKRRQNNIQVRIKENISRRLRSKMLNVIKERKTIDYLGCDIDFFKVYIESKMKPGMTWDNYGRDGWHLDHIIPCSYFDLTKQEEIFKCFNYTNYDPKWAIDNLSKGDRFIG